MTTDWLAGILSREDYEIVSKDRTQLVLKHAERPNVTVRVFREQEYIGFVHGWLARTPGWLDDPERTTLLNALNRSSVTQTYSIDRDGDLQVHSYIASSDPVSPTTIRMFLERDAARFAVTSAAHDLARYLK